MYRIYLRLYDLIILLPSSRAQSEAQYDDITELAEHAGSLFIDAATAVRYIRAVGIAVNSKARLKVILAISAESHKKLSAIDALYTAILISAIDHPELEPGEQSQRRLVIWNAVCACEPVLIRTLSVLSTDPGSKTPMTQQPQYSQHVPYFTYRS